MTRQKNRLYRLLALLPACCSFAANAQQTGIDIIKKTVENATTRERREQLFVHTDKDFYLAGELCWFRIYAMDAASNRPAGISKVAYIEIIDAQGRPATQAKIAMDSSGGYGSFYLPVSMNSGNYELRAYTNWMKNAGSSSFFTRQLTVVNTLKNSTGILAKDPPDAMIEFYPEGGQLVNDMEGRIAFSLHSSSGTPLNGHLVVTTDNGDTIVHADASHQGMGRFLFTPVGGRKFSATASLADGRTFSKDLPDAQRDGYTMMADADAGGQIHVTVKSNIAAQQGRPVYLVCHANNKVYAARQQNIQLETSITIPRAELPAGVTTCTLFDFRQQPVAERLLFNKPASPAATLSINTGKENYATRQPVSVSVDYEGKGMLDYSASVFLLDSFQKSPETITEYFLLTRELAGGIDNPSYYFAEDPSSAQQADNLMLTAGWRTFGKPDPSPAYVAAPETMGHTVVARVVSLPDEKPAANIVCFFSAGVTPFEFLIARSDSNGLVRFNTRKYYGPGDIIIQTQSWQGKSLRVDVSSPFVPASSAAVQPFFIVREDLRSQLVARSVAMQALNVYNTDSMSNFLTPVLTDTLPFYGRAEYSYMLDDYKRFTTMEEVLREYVTPVGVGMKNGKLTLNVFDAKNQTIFRKELVLLLLDGIPLQDPDKVFAVDPLKIRRIDVIPSVYMYGPSVFTGVISLESYNGHSEGIDLDKSLLSVDYEGLQLKREFYVPDYISGTANLRRVPDLRNTLQWIPKGTAMAGKPVVINFPSSDVKGNFLIVVEGMTSEGVPVASTKLISVE